MTDNECGSGREKTKMPMWEHLRSEKRKSILEPPCLHSDKTTYGLVRLILVLNTQRERERREDGKNRHETEERKACADCRRRGRSGGDRKESMNGKRNRIVQKAPIQSTRLIIMLNTASQALSRED